MRTDALDAAVRWRKRYENCLSLAVNPQLCDSMDADAELGEPDHGHEMLPLLIWIDTDACLTGKARRLFQLLHRLRPDFNWDGQLAPTHLSVPLADITLDKELTALLAAANPRIHVVLLEILSWASRGETDTDVALRCIVICHLMLISPWGELSFSEIAEIKQISKQRIEDLASEFKETYFTGI